MRKILLPFVFTALGVIAAWAGWWLFLDGRAAAVRTDLVRMPDVFGPPPKGYATENALVTSYFIGNLELLDTENPPPLPHNVSVRYDVEYGREGDIPLRLDLYQPLGATTPRPAVLFIHGGGWSKGDRHDYGIYAQQFAAWGYVTATMSYRFSDVAKFPGCISDAKCAVRWLRANAEELGVASAQIAAVGGSAGGYLAMMLGYTSDVSAFEGSGGNPGVSSVVQAVVDLYGPTDLTKSIAQTHASVVGLLGVAYTENPDRYREASPITHLDASDPPTFIIQGTLDSTVPSSQSDLLAEKLQSLGMDYWYDVYPGWPHTMDKARPVTDRVQATMRAFLEHVFGKPTIP